MEYLSEVSNSGPSLPDSCGTIIIYFVTFLRSMQSYFSPKNGW